jgi:hypothetical protein
MIHLNPGQPKWGNQTFVVSFVAAAERLESRLPRRLVATDAHESGPDRDLTK